MRLYLNRDHSEYANLNILPLPIGRKLIKPIKPGKVEQSIIGAFRARGFKLTRQRRAIIHVVANDRSHPSAMTIYKKSGRKTPNISLSTVYYTLNILKKEGLIKELEFDERDNRYDGNTAKHLNLICTVCGRIEDFSGKLPLLAKHVETQTGFQTRDMRMEYYGYCRKCRNKL